MPLEVTVCLNVSLQILVLLRLREVLFRDSEKILSSHKGETKNGGI